MKKILEVQKIRGGYETPYGFVRAVDGCSLVAYEGEILGIAGESGCGKSTFAHLIIGYVKPPLKVLEGTSIIDNTDIYKLSWTERRTKVWGRLVSVIPQYSMNSLNPTKRIKDLVLDVIREKYRTPPPKDKIIEMARVRFEELGLSDKVLDMYPIELSGGMKQRAVIAISTLLNPKLLIADEPTSALDVSTQKRLLQLLYNLVRRKNIVRTLIMISHDIATLRQICDRMCIMYAGKIVELASTEDIINYPLHPYTKGLINSVVSVEPSLRKKVLKGIPGAPPNLINPPPGCRFHPRCPNALPICYKKEPPLVEINERRYVACWLYAET